MPNNNTVPTFTTTQGTQLNADWARIVLDEIDENPPLPPQPTSVLPCVNTEDNWRKLLAGFEEIFEEPASISGVSIASYFYGSKRNNVILRCSLSGDQLNERVDELGWGNSRLRKNHIFFTDKSGQREINLFFDNKEKPDDCYGILATYTLKNGLIASDETRKDWENKTLTATRALSALEKEKATMYAASIKKNGGAPVKFVDSKEWWRK